MKKGVRLLNCARGGILNEADLLAGLQSGQVGPPPSTSTRPNRLRRISRSAACRRSS